MNYTKGEWEKSLSGFEFDNGIRKLVSSKEQYIIAEVGGKSTNEAEANAHLISAAPDMYEALKEANNLINLARQFFPKSLHNSNKFQLENICATINKAIAKAEGK